MLICCAGDWFQETLTEQDISYVASIIVTGSRELARTNLSVVTIN